MSDDDATELVDPNHREGSTDLMSLLASENNHDENEGSEKDLRVGDGQKRGE